MFRNFQIRLPFFQKYRKRIRKCTKIMKTSKKKWEKWLLRERGAGLCFLACGSANCLNCLPIIHPTQWPPTIRYNVHDTYNAQNIALHPTQWWSTKFMWVVLSCWVMQHIVWKTFVKRCKVGTLWDNRSWSMTVGDALPLPFLSPLYTARPSPTFLAWKYAACNFLQ